MTDPKKAHDEIVKAGKNGHFFSVRFVKKTNGAIRNMNARLDVSKYVTGEGLKFDPAKKNLMVVWDAQVKDYRMVNLETVTHINGKEIDNA